MTRLFAFIVIFLNLNFYSNWTWASPWFTGPLLAPAGHIVPKNHTNFELYGLDVHTDGQYNNAGKIIPRSQFHSFIVNPVLTHGFTNWLDGQATIPYIFNSTQGVHDNRITDTTLGLGLQLMEQKGSSKRADIRLLVQETFPTGRFEHLNPQLLGTDSSGAGSYQTQVALNFQYLQEVFTTHYLRTRLMLSYLYAGPVSVHGFNSYGGKASTVGHINSGSEKDADLAFEFTLNQHWVAVLEGTLSKGQATLFNGILDIGNIGGPSTLSGPYKEKALAPAIEYNFNQNIGLIGGVWFPVSGKNTAHYRTYILALNTYW